MQKLLIFLVSFFGLIIPVYAGNVDDSENSLYNFVFNFNNGFENVTNYYDNGNKDLNSEVKKNLGKVKIQYSLLNEVEVVDGVRINLNYTIVSNEDKNQPAESRSGYFILKKGNDSFKVTSTNVFDTYHSSNNNFQERCKTIYIVLAVSVGIIIIAIITLCLIVQDRNYMKSMLELDDEITNEESPRNKTKTKKSKKLIKQA